ncbi:prolyl oligopeptidase family serine peptidase [Cohnella soli]|uniref:Prolyl oligopeptidase family serine peptidase n=1 Tax=Cohnella soli TaxID=425005 RepID=A0ABW0HUN5_9BACL
MTQRNVLVNDGQNLNYLLYFPETMVTNQILPLIIFLHSIDERGNDLELLKIHSLPHILDNKSDFPFIVVSPQCPAQSFWNNETDKIIALIDEMMSNYSVDPTRVYLTGISMGGYGAWDLATKYPERFAAIMPLCGGGTPEKASVLAKLPVWAFHGAKDEIVPLQETLNMVEALKQCGGNVKLTVFPDAGHDLTDTYNDPMLYEWLLQHTIVG